MTEQHSRIVMRDLARDMVENVCLRDSMGSMGADPAHNGTKVSEQAAVQSSEGTTLEVELLGTVMGKEGIGVLQEGDQYEPVVDPEYNYEKANRVRQIMADTYQR